MDKTYFLHLFVLTLLIVTSISTENSPKLKLKRSNLETDHQASSLLLKNIYQTPSNKLSSPYFSVDVSFTPNDQDKTFPMAIALYSSNTILIAPIGQCQHFVPFDCQTFDCLEYQGNKTSTSYPYFNANGYFGKTYLYLDFANWNLETKTVMATSCIDSNWPSYCAGTYGILGMGVAVSSWANFRGLQPWFAISIDLDQQDGEILFSLDSAKFKEDVPPVTLFADNNWRISNIQSIQIGKTQLPTSNFSLLFDINIDAIGFPLSIYERLLKSFTDPDQKPLECNQTYYKPACNYSGNITHLPTIYIHFGNQEIIQIPSEIYVKASSDGSIVLNIKAVDPSLSGPFNYIRKDFANFIFLDSNFFHFYYVVFNGSNYTQNNNTIGLYQAYHPKNQLDNQSYLKEIIILGIIFGFFMSLLIISCLVRKSSGRRNQRIEIQNPVESHSNYENFPEAVFKSAVFIPRKRKIESEESELFIQKTKSEPNSPERIFHQKEYLNRPGSNGSHIKIIGNCSNPYYSLEDSSDDE